MSGVEQRLRDGLADAEADAAPPGDPVAWVRARVARDRRRRAVGGAVAGVALAGAAALVLPSLPGGGGDRLTGQVAEQPPAAPAGDGPALVVHNTASGDGVAAADAGIQVCLERPDVRSRTVDAAEPAAYVVTAGVQARLSEVEGCLTAIPGVLVEREIEALAGRGPVPVATMPGGGAVHRDASQQVLADQVVDRLRELVTAKLGGEVQEHPGAYATTRTPTGPSRNVGGMVQWHDERGYVTVMASRVERLNEPRVDACAAGPSAPELECARVTPEGGGADVTVFTGNGTRRVRTAVYALSDGSGVSVTQMPLDAVGIAAPAPGEVPIRRVTPRPDLPLSDSDLAAIAVSLAE